MAERLGAPVITTFSSRGVIPASHPLSVNGPAHEQAVIELARSADLAIVIGSDLDHMNTMAWKFPLPDTRITINVDSADANKNYPMTATMIAAANTGAALLAHADRRQPWANLVAVHRQIADDLANDSHATEAGKFLEDTRLALDDDVTIFCDMAINGYWLSGYYGVERPRSLHYPMGWGTLGFALPAAIGAAAAGQTTVAFCGDGGALFAIGELATIAQENLPLTTVVIDDNAYGMLRYGRESERSDIGTELAAVDFVAVAGGFGIASQRIDGFGPDYVNALRDATASGTPHLLHVLAELLPPRTTTPRWILK